MSGNRIEAITYHYNANGLRDRKTLFDGNQAQTKPQTKTQTTQFVYAPDTRLFSTSNQTLTTQYIWLGGQPIAQIEKPAHQPAQTTIIYLHTDHLLTPRIATNEQQKIVWRWQSDAFGETLTDTDADKDGKHTTIQLRFPGQYADEESGLYYNVNRYYDPKSGRYTQSDPIGLGGGLNSFAYVGGSPAQLSDPLGLRALTSGEITLAQSIFGSSIDYSKVNIYQENFWGIVPIPKQRAMTPNGNIFFNTANTSYRDDFSVSDLDLQGLFIHEMTHVWQKQHGTTVYVNGIYQRGYSYDLSCGKKFSDYGIEAQGNMVMDYFFTKNSYKTYQWGSQTAEYNYTVQDFEKVMVDFINETTTK